MATASIPATAPVDTAAMAARRLPLADVPNAVNSPFRSAAAGKRSRAQAGDLRDPTHGQPPAKKQIVEEAQDDENIDPRRRTAVPVPDEPFARRSATSQPTVFERKLAAVREKKPASTQRPDDRSQNPNGANIENVRQWQRHYRRQFPQYVFYFDGISNDLRSKLFRQVQSLGAREDRFFSKNVTHVVTARPVPPEGTSATTVTATATHDHPASQAKAAASSAQRTATMLDGTLQRRAQANQVHVPPVHSHAADILTRARELGIKIWALEKLQRILSTMLEANTGEQGATQDLHPAVTAATAAAVATAPSTTAPAANARPTVKSVKAADLEQMLRNEKINGPADRDMTVAASDMCAFKGCFIYVHDMDEKTKPVMVRDYPKPASKDQGKWPQFRHSGPGRCPFVEDPAEAKRIQEQHQQQQQQQAKAQHELASQRRTRASAATEETSTQPLTERAANLRRSPRKQASQGKNDLAKPLDPPKIVPAKRQPSTEGMPPVFGSAQVNLRGLPRMIGGEPVASGIQHSNVTSAIRSQAVSSAAISSTAPGLNRRLPDSKEVSALKRKVLERGASATSQLPSSYMNDMRAAINEEHPGPPPRAAKRKAQENLLGVVLEDEDVVQHPASKKRKTAPRKRKAEKEPKPGYCENCRDKFDDFDEHINSRKHQKFARTSDNWRELDALLSQLRRPHKLQ